MDIDKKAPTWFQILGVCLLVGLIGGLIAAYYDPFGIGGRRGIRLENDFALQTIGIVIVFNLIGAGIGIYSQKTRRAKLIGLWIGAILFSILCILGPGLIYIIIGGQ